MLQDGRRLVDHDGRHEAYWLRAPRRLTMEYRRPARHVEISTKTIHMGKAIDAGRRPPGAAPEPMWT